MGEINSDAGETHSAASQFRRLLYGIAILALLSLLCAPFFRNSLDQGGPRASKGDYDAGSFTNWAQPVQLAGQWRLEFRTTPDAAALVALADVPGSWKGIVTLDGQKLPPNGIGTYRLHIHGLPPGRFRLYVPSIYAGTEVSINGQRVSARGVAGNDAASTRVYVRPQNIWIDGGRDIDLTIKMSTFLHRDNGLESAPVIGRSEAMDEWSGLRWSQEFLFHISLVLLTIYGLVVFLFRRDDRASLYFALSCLLFQPASAVIGYDNLLLMAFPNVSFVGMLAAVYLPGVLCVAFFLAYANELFPKESPRRLFLAFQPAFAGFFLFETWALLKGDTLLASNTYSAFIALAILSMLTMIYIIIRACFRQRDGAVIFLLGMVFFFLIILLLSLVGNGVIPRDKAVGIDLTAYGMLMLLFSHIVILAERWSVAMDETRAMNADLRSLLDVSTSIVSEIQLGSLLAKIVEVTSRIVHADRSSLFLHDARTDELWSMVAQGDGVGEIRMAATSGIAGKAFSRGETLSIEKPYEESAFNPAIDEQTGYRTRNILAMPIVTRDGRKLGVMQALNKRGGAFDERDSERMSAFAAQAAVALDNATLFSEVIASRNYNDSILRSMSSGVITLDRRSRIAKLNAAACAILDVDESVFENADAFAIIARTNGWLIKELDEVSDSAASKVLLDVELRTGSGATKSVNISMVPLVNAEASGGILVLLEDISEGKRLRGAMRRFMPQKIVDQVLDRSDDLLFGSACQASVLFADIRNFTSMTEKLTPRETVDMLNEVFTELFEAVASTDGILDKYIGDAVMAVYGVPFASDRDPLNSVDAAVQMVRMIETINAGRKLRGLADLRLGVGIATGEVVAGTIGSPKRMDYTVIGDSVNLAARLQDLTKEYKAAIIVCEKTAARVGDSQPMRELDLIRVRGRERPARIFEVIAPPVGLDSVAIAASLSAWDKARQALAGRKWRAAEDGFGAVLALNPEDGPAALMRERARAAIDSPPSDDWDGVW